jgi:hypothetical protein
MEGVTAEAASLAGRGSQFSITTSTSYAETGYPAIFGMPGRLAGDLAVGEPLLSDGHPHACRGALPERPCRGFHPGHLGLDNLCWVSDNNHITIEGSTSLAFTEDVAARFIALMPMMSPELPTYRSHPNVEACSTFGASAPLKSLQEKFGFEPERVAAAAKELLGER